MEGKHVIVRAYSGLFFGRLIKKTGDTVELADARQIWRWGSAGLSEPANTAGDLAVRGCGTNSKISSPVSRALIEEVRATFECTAAAVERFSAQRWAQ